MAVKRKKRKAKKQKGSFGKFFILVMVLVVISLAIYYLASDLKIPVQIKDIISKKTDKPVVPEEITVTDSIIAAAMKFNITRKQISVKEGESETNIRIPVNRELYDLYIVNMVVTGSAELAGGVLVSGEENKNATSQNLVFEDKEKHKYNVKLYYSRRVSKKPSKQLAIIVDDFGTYSSKLIDRFAEDTDPAVTFAIIPGERTSDYAMEKGSNTGHELMIHMPMEPKSYPRDDPGKNAIFVDQTPKQIKRIVGKYIKELPLCKGANNHMGSLATSDEDVMNAVLEVLKENGMYFVDSRTAASSVGYDIAQKMLVPSKKRDIFLDVPDTSDESFEARLADIKKLFKHRRQVVVITHCKDEKRLKHINRLIDYANSNNIDVVPVSELFKNDVPDV